MRRAHGLHAAALQIGAQLLVTLAGYLTTVIVAKQLGAALFGAFSVVYGTLLAIEVIGRLGIPQALTRQVAAAHGAEASRIASGGMLLGAGGYMILFGLFWLGAPQLAAALNVADGTRLFRIAALDIPFYGLVFVLLAALHGTQRHAMAALVTALYAVAKAIGILALAAYGVSIAGALLVNVAASVAGLAVAVIAVRRMIARPSLRAIGATVRGALPLSVRGVASQLLAVLGLWALGVAADLVPPEAVGQYAAALAIGRLPIILALGWSSILIAGVATALAREDREQARRQVRDGGLLMLILLVPPGAVVAVEGGALLTLLFGPDYSDAGALLAVLFAGQGIGMTMLLMLTAALVGASRPELAMRVNLLALVVALAALPLILPLGAMGAAVATAAGCLVGSVVAGVQATTFLGAWLSPRDAVRIALVTLAVGLAASLIPSAGLWLLVELCALAILQLALLVAAGLVSTRSVRTVLGRPGARAPSAV